MAKKGVLAVKIQKRLVDLIEVSILASKLYFGDIEKAKLWIFCHHKVFSGDSPFEVILRGDGKSIIEFLKVRSGRKPGSAF